MLFDANQASKWFWKAKKYQDGAPIRSLANNLMGSHLDTLVKP
jgi:hypothetical protein